MALKWREPTTHGAQTSEGPHRSYGAARKPQKKPGKTGIKQQSDSLIRNFCDIGQTRIGKDVKMTYSPE